MLRSGCFISVVYLFEVLLKFTPFVALVGTQYLLVEISPSCVNENCDIFVYFLLTLGRVCKHQTVAAWVFLLIPFHICDMLFLVFFFTCHDPVSFFSMSWPVYHSAART